MDKADYVPGRLVRRYDWASYADGEWYFATAGEDYTNPGTFQGNLYAWARNHGYRAESRSERERVDGTVGIYFRIGRDLDGDQLAATLAAIGNDIAPDVSDS
jgi:hypothetical protein